MTQNEATESNMAIVNYDTTFPIDDYRRYFKYEDRIMGGIVIQLTRLVSRTFFQKSKYLLVFQI
jgi:hypothetical protein